MAALRFRAALLIVSAVFGMAAPLSADEAERQRLRKEILAQKGIDARRWGEDIANPFTNLTGDVLKRLAGEGVDTERLRKLRTVLVTGTIHLARDRKFVNKDPDTILVLDKDFVTARAIYSLGPVLALGKGFRVRQPIIGADLVWFVEGARPTYNASGVPLWAEPEDAGWRRPKDFLKLPAPRSGPVPLAAADADRKRQALRQRVLDAGGVDVSQLGDVVANPFKALSPKGRAKWAARGIDPRRLRKLKAVLLTGGVDATRRRTSVNRDPDTILMLGGDFVTDGDIFSLGPILAVGRARVHGDVVGADLVWFVEEAFCGGRMSGLPVVLAPTFTDLSLRFGGDDVWFGDYGWDRPDDFLMLLPRQLTHEELNNLWDDLSGADARRAKRALSRFIAGAEDSLPYLRRRLQTPPRPTGERLDRLLDDLDSEQFETREAATRELDHLRLTIEPQLRLLLHTRTTLEVRRRLEHILDGVKSDKQRIRQALAVLDKLFTPEARRLLRELAEGDDDLFLTREAQAVLRRLDR